MHVFESNFRVKSAKKGAFFYLKTQNLNVRSIIKTVLEAFCFLRATLYFSNNNIKIVIKSHTFLFYLEKVVPSSHFKEEPATPPLNQKKVWNRPGYVIKIYVYRSRCIWLHLRNLNVHIQFIWWMFILIFVRWYILYICVFMCLTK